MDKYDEDISSFYDGELDADSFESLYQILLMQDLKKKFLCTE